MKGLVFCILVGLPCTSVAADVRLTHQGRVIDSAGDPLQGNTSISLELWRSATSTDVANERLYAEDFGIQRIDDGYYSVVLGANGGLDSELLRGEVYLEVQVNGVGLEPRTLLSATPIAATTVAPVVDGIPAGAVVPFDLVSCPSGWSEYEQAKGRFIRGLDTAGAVDPDGASRSIGSVQSHQLASHSHTSNYWSNEVSGNVLSERDNVVGNGGTAQGRSQGDWVSDESGGSETRPVNVALLYCRKD